MLVDKEIDKNCFGLHHLEKSQKIRRGEKETYRRKVLANNEIVPKGNNRHLSF